MKEPVLFNSKSKNDIYRFTWLRSFDKPIIIRIEKNRDNYSIFWKEGNHDDKKPGLLINGQKVIDKAHWDIFMYRVKQIGFWNMPAIDPEKPGADGAEWILEGKLPNKYHVVDRWSPVVGTDYYKCCDYLISLTDLKIDPKRKY